VWVWQLKNGCGCGNSKVRGCGNSKHCKHHPAASRVFVGVGFIFFDEGVDLSKSLKDLLLRSTINFLDGEVDFLKSLKALPPTFI